MTCTSGQPLSRLTSRRRWLATLATTTSLLLVGGCGSTQANDEGFVAGDGSLTILPIDRRPTAPVIEGVTLDDQPWTSAKISDKVIVYNVWGSWCAPCVSEAPALVRASRRLDNQAAFVGLNTRDFDKAAPRAFVLAYEIPYVNLFDPQGALILRFSGELPPNAIPSTIVIDRQGRLAARIIGETTEATLVGLVQDIAAGR